MEVFAQDTDKALDGVPVEAESSRPRLGLALARLLWEKRRLLVGVTAAGMVLSLVIAFLIPKTYESTGRLMPPDTRSPAGLLGLLSNNPMGNALAGDLLGTKNSGALFLGILKSRTVQDRLIEQYDLRKVYKTSYQYRAREELSGNTDVAEDAKSGVITISVRDRDPRRAAAMVNSYFEELDRLNRDLNTSTAHRQRLFLEERLTAVKHELDLAARKFSTFASDSGALDIQEQGKAMLGAAARVQAELVSAQSELRGLQQMYADENVRVKAVKARIGELQRQLDRHNGSTNSLSGMIRDLPKLGPAYSELYRNTKIQEAVYEALTKEYEMAKVQEVKEIPMVKVLDPGIAPERKVLPKRTWILVLGTMLSFMFASAYVVASALWAAIDDTDDRKQFALEVFATIAHWTPSRLVRTRSGATRAQAGVRPETSASEKGE
jgi:uncharacterized protein involved in exopolysaccharide biosynthesis